MIHQNDRLDEADRATHKKSNFLSKSPPKGAKKSYLQPSNILVRNAIWGPSVVVGATGSYGAYNLGNI